MDYAALSAVLSSNIGRIVAFVLTPILLPLAGAGSVWLQNVAGIDLDPTETTAYVVTVIAGLALVIFKWIENRGRFEIAAVEVQKLHAQGQKLP